MLLLKHIELTRKEEGCLAFNVTQDIKNKNIFNVHEAFINRKAFEAHQLRVQKSDWGNASMNVERHYQINECN